MGIERLRDVPIGTRVVVRYLIDEGQRATDALGPLTHLTESTVSLDTTAGPIDIPVYAVVAAKPIPPAPTRRPPPS